ncbi:MAG: hypothetical protein AAGB18_04355, partial [Pseudomonadota bacterium]
QRAVPGPYAGLAESLGDCARADRWACFAGRALPDIDRKSAVRPHFGGCAQADPSAHGEQDLPIPAMR